MRITPAAIEQLAITNSPSEFFLALIESGKRRLSLAECASRCGFASKSYLSEVSNGKKALSLEAAKKISRGFKLNLKLSRILELLVLSQQARSEGRTDELGHLNGNLLTLRKMVLRKNVEKNTHDESVEIIFEHRVAIQVFASMGSGQSGATIAEIFERSGLSLAEIETALSHLMKASFVVQVSDRFFVTTENVDFKDLNSSLSFAKAFREEVAFVAKNSGTLVGRGDALCMYGAFSIDGARKNEFKQRLRELLLDFMDEAGDEDGSKIAKICCAFY